MCETPLNQSHLNALCLNDFFYANCSKRTDECVLKNEVCVLFAIQYSIQCETHSHNNTRTPGIVPLPLVTHSLCMSTATHSTTKHDVCFGEIKDRIFKRNLYRLCQHTIQRCTQPVHTHSTQLLATRVSKPPTFVHLNEYEFYCVLCVYTRNVAYYAMHECKIQFQFHFNTICSAGVYVCTCRRLSNSSIWPARITFALWFYNDFCSFFVFSHFILRRCMFCSVRVFSSFFSYHGWPCRRLLLEGSWHATYAL